MEMTSPYTFPLIYFALLIIGFGIGFVSHRYFFPHEASKEKERGKERIAYIKGVNYILSDAPDLAIEEFIKAVQINSDTIETYLALGNLFRSKGELSRAIRIHQGIIVRPNIDPKLVIQAMYDLGLDYKKAGFINRAISQFQEVIQKDPKHLNAYRQLEGLYEEIGEWERAYTIQEKISKISGSNNSNILAHLLTEHAKSLFNNGNLKEARKAFKRALAIDPLCVDSYLHWGDLEASEGHYSTAVKLWEKVMDLKPQFTYLAYNRLEDTFFKMGKINALEDMLRMRAEKGQGHYFTHLYLAKHLRKKAMPQDAITELKKALELNPNSPSIRKELIQILLDLGKKDEALKEYEELMGLLTPGEKEFQCQKCGYQSDSILWKCPQCLNWDTISFRIRPKEEELRVPSPGI
jgi:lipopolysaccharide biosynthesis regulator YciM